MQNSKQGKGKANSSDVEDINFRFIDNDKNLLKKWCAKLKKMVEIAKRSNYS